MKKFIDIDVQEILTRRVYTARQVINSIGLTKANTSTSISYHASSGRACKYSNMLLWCVGYLVMLRNQNVSTWTW
jgi:hypothetical protein